MLPPVSAIEIERMAPEGWERVRATRLRALADAPDAFATTLAQDQARPPESWRTSLEDSGVATFLAVRDGEDVGLVVGAPWRGRDGVAGLFAMWVTPDARGSGAADALVRAVVAWARGEGFRRLVLEVADENPAAVCLYERHGFLPTGATGTLPPPRTHVREHERALELASD